MQFRSPSRHNPLTNPIIAALVQVLAVAGVVIGVFKALEASSWLPVLVAAVFLTAVEGLWLYFTLRR
jgi:hypothetical protein